MKDMETPSSFILPKFRAYLKGMETWLENKRTATVLLVKFLS
jgi:hypothetical protein